MSINFLDPETLSVSNGSLSATGRLGSLSRDLSSAKTIPSSKDVTGIELRMLPPLIKDNHTPVVFPFPGYSKLYCLTIVVSDVTNESVGGIDLKGFPRIGDHEHLPINKTIYFFQSDKASDKGPSQIHIMCTVMKSKQSLREAGEVMGQVKDDSEYKGLIKSIGQLAKDATKFNLVADAVVQVAGIVGKYLGKVEDKPLGTIVNSYTTLHGDFDKVGISKLVYPTRDVDFEFEMVVRKAGVEAKLQKSLESGASRGLALDKKTKSNLTEKEEKVVVELTPL